MVGIVERTRPGFLARHDAASRLDRQANGIVAVAEEHRSRPVPSSFATQIEPRQYGAPIQVERNECERGVLLRIYWIPGLLTNESLRGRERRKIHELAIAKRQIGDCL